MRVSTSCHDPDTRLRTGCGGDGSPPGIIRLRATLTKTFANIHGRGSANHAEAGGAWLTFQYFLHAGAIGADAPDRHLTWTARHRRREFYWFWSVRPVAA